MIEAEHAANVLAFGPERAHVVQKGQLRLPRGCTELTSQVRRGLRVTVSIQSGDVHTAGSDVNRGMSIRLFQRRIEGT